MFISLKISFLDELNLKLLRRFTTLFGNFCFPRARSEGVFSLFWDVAKSDVAKDVMK